MKITHNYKITAGYLNMETTSRRQATTTARGWAQGGRRVEVKAFQNGQELPVVSKKLTVAANR